MALTDEEKAVQLEEEYTRLRKFLNPAIKGPVTDAVLYAMASAGRGLVHNVEAVDDQMYVVSAVDKYLDQRLADSNLTRPGSVGLSDEVFSEIGIEVVNRKQVRDLIHKLLGTMYGDDFAKASIKSNTFEPYSLVDGDEIFISFDDQTKISIPFSASQFSNISAATAQEVSDVITKTIRNLGLTGSAITKDDGSGAYIEIVSNTLGPSSSVKILGGRAQNELKFDLIRPTSGAASTQWTLLQQPSGTMRATWSAGANPNIGKVKSGDYVNIFGSAFTTDNKGTFDVVAAQGGTVGNAYFEYDNAIGVSETQLQGTTDGLLFFNASRKTLNSKARFAAAYQTENRTLEIFMPATTKVVRRDRQGAAHLHGPTSVANTGAENGPYIYDLSKGYTIGDVAAATTTELNSGSSNVFAVDDSSNFPDEVGYLVLGFGTSHEEGPIPYIARPSSGSIMVNPAYKFQNVHPTGTDVALVTQNSPFIPSKGGTDYPCYLTDNVSGRLYAEELINTVAATGIGIVITILYPSDVGLGKYGTEFSEKEYIWGTDIWPKTLTLNEDT